MKQNINSSKTTDHKYHVKNKGIISILLIMVLLGYSFTLKSQISLVHTYSQDTEGVLPSFNEDINCFVGGPTYGKIKLYNSDCSLYKTIETENSQFNTIAYFFSRYFFNDDDKIEFLVPLYISASGGVSRVKLCLYNEDGELLYNFGETLGQNNSTFSPEIFTTQEGGRYLSIRIGKNSGPDRYTKKIFLLHQNSDNISPISVDKSSENKHPYPNPAKEIINLPYKLGWGESATMYIYNLKGQIIEEKMIDHLFENLALDVSGYEKGLYIYKVNNISKEFIVN